MWGGVNLKKSGLASALPKGDVSQKKGFGTPGDFIPPLPMPVRDKERQEAIKKRSEAKETMEDAIRQRQREQRQEREWYKNEEKARLKQMERDIMLRRGKLRQEEFERKAKLDSEMQALEEKINKEVYTERFARDIERARHEAALQGRILEFRERDPINKRKALEKAKIDQQEKARNLQKASNLFGKKSGGAQNKFVGGKWSRMKANVGKGLVAELKQKLIEDPTDYLSMKQLGSQCFKQNQFRPAAILLLESFEKGGVVLGPELFVSLSRACFESWKESKKKYFLSKRSLYTFFTSIELATISLLLLICVCLQFIVSSFEAMQNAMRYFENICRAELWHTSGMLHTHLGSHEGALQTFGRLISDFPESSWVGPTILKCSMLLMHFKKNDLAAGYLNNLMVSPPDPFTELHLQFIMAFLKQDDETCKAADFEHVFEALKNMNSDNWCEFGRIESHDKCDEWLSDVYTWKEFGRFCLEQEYYSMSISSTMKALDITTAIRAQLLEQATCKVRFKCTALEDFEGKNEEELPFREGDILAVLDVEAPEGWFVAKHDEDSSQKEGLVPQTYVEELENQSEATLSSFTNPIKNSLPKDEDMKEEISTDTDTLPTLEGRGIETNPPVDTMIESHEAQCHRKEGTSQHAAHSDQIAKDEGCDCLDSKQNIVREEKFNTPEGQPAEEGNSPSYLKKVSAHADDGKEGVTLEALLLQEIDELRYSLAQAKFAFGLHLEGISITGQVVNEEVKSKLTSWVSGCSGDGKTELSPGGSIAELLQNI